MTLKENQRKIMEQLDVSPTDLARLSKIPYRTIQRLINDETSDPRLSTIKPVIISLGVSADMVIFDDEQLGKNGDLEILFWEIIKLEGRDRETVKDVLRALIIQNRNKELYQ